MLSFIYFVTEADHLERCLDAIGYHSYLKEKVKKTKQVWNRTPMTTKEDIIYAGLDVVESLIDIGIIQKLREHADYIDFSYDCQLSWF